MVRAVLRQINLWGSQAACAALHKLDVYTDQTAAVIWTKECVGSGEWWGVGQEGSVKAGPR